MESSPDAVEEASDDILVIPRLVIPRSLDIMV